MATKKTTTKRTARNAASKKRRSNKAPSKAQLAARAKFAAAAKARSKKAKNKTIIKAKTIQHLDVSKIHNGKTTRRKYRNGYLDLVIKGTAEKTTQGWKVGSKTIPQGKGIAPISSGYYLDKTTGMIFAKRARNDAKASPKARQIRKDFTGMESKKTAVLLAPKGTPTNLAKLGKLILIKTERGTIKPPNKGTTWLCADTKGKLHIATSVPYDGSTGSFGEVTQVEYETAKPHLGYKNKTIFFHKMGEEGGRKPTLSADNEGLRFRGGSYKITRQGIVD